MSTHADHALVDVVAKAPAMDDAEKHALAAVCGASVADVPWGSSRALAFAAHLVDVITRYQLDAFFRRDPERSINASTYGRAESTRAPTKSTRRR
jgi:hypothetical protein